MANCVQALEEAVCFSHSANIAGEGMNPNILSLAMGKIVEQTFFNLGMATDLGEGENSEFKPAKLLFKRDLVSQPVRVERFVTTHFDAAV